MAKKVRVVNSCMVPPALPTPSEPIWLSNLDLFSSPVHVPTVFFFRNNSSPQLIPSPAASIKDSLARILVPYYPFAGRFGKSADGRREIKCTGEGALFLEVVSDLTLDEFSIYNNSLKNYSLLVPTDELNSCSEIEDDDKIPILLFQLTTFRCGGLCLGTAINHQAADGIAALHFICNWAATTRDPRQPFPTPSFNHTSLRPRSPPSVQFPHPEFDLREGSENQMTSFIYLHLTPVQLGAIKALGDGKYSSFEYIAAYIWRCACLARGSARPDEKRRFLTAADMRRRVSQLFPNNYIGNATMITAAIASSTEVVASTLQLAKIREAIEKLTEEYLQSAVDLLELPDKKQRLSRFTGKFSAMDISVTSWSEFPLYEADFGWGSPEFIVPTAHTLPGHFLILPNLNGGVKIACSLEAEKMEGFVKLFYELLPTTRL